MTDESLESLLTRLLTPIIRAAVRAELAAARDVPEPPTAPSELPALLRRAEAAAYLGISIRTLERFEACGRIRFVRLNARAVRVPGEEVLRLAEAGTHGGMPQTAAYRGPGKPGRFAWLTEALILPSERDVPIFELGLSVRVENALTHGKIVSTRDLERIPPAELLKLRGFGRESLSDLRVALMRHGFTCSRPKRDDVVITVRS